jgi:hypothetical protein
MRGSLILVMPEPEKAFLALSRDLNLILIPGGTGGLSDILLGIVAHR